MCRCLSYLLSRCLRSAMLSVDSSASPGRLTCGWGLQGFSLIELLTVLAILFQLSVFGPRLGTLGFTSFRGLRPFPAQTSQALVTWLAALVSVVLPAFLYSFGFPIYLTVFLCMEIVFLFRLIRCPYPFVSTSAALVLLLMRP